MMFDKEFIIEFLQVNGYTIVEDVEIDNARITGAIEEGCECISIDQEYTNVFKKLLQSKLLSL